ncbi:glyoxylate reductase [Thalassobacillus cyri]|uniref:Glyoxylate reductase n=1 Tax=Thalassobacillus cyri TaxID=571932 RepID=A0A1H4AGF2_9BACI|nr:D-glycerate dehydrogenase [Thalassobacillus cyri]SEA34821.1 glyoxylate reductase [Thalassobacillus cyri]
MKPKVYITRKLNDRVVKKIEEACEVKMWEEEEVEIPREILMKEAQEVDGLLCMLTENIDDELLSCTRNLKVVSNMAVGYNNIDITAAKNRGITVTNTPGVLTETTADLTFTLLMATARRIVESSDYLRKGKWETWSPMQLTGQDIHGATLGIIGMGRIGEAVIKRAKGFDMNIIYHNRNRKYDIEEELGVVYAGLDELLRDSDFACVLTPYTSETHHLISEREFSLMKETSVLINTARGGIVDEEALYHALKKKEIWAAGLDVFEQEPLPLDHPLLALPNVVTLPHIGSASIQTRLKMADLAAENLLRAVTKQTPEHVVV